MSTVRSSTAVAVEHAVNIGTSVENMWHDPLVEMDNTTTISACENMKTMYSEEQEVSQLVIDDMEQEQKNLSSISEVFKYTDVILSTMLGEL